MNRLLIGSTAERLLNRLPTSLLVVPINKRALRRPIVEPMASGRRGERQKGRVLI